MSCNLKPYLEKFLKTVRKYRLISPGDRVLVAFSGGPDSVFLLKMLYETRNLLKVTLAVSHLHHGIRGYEADRDLEFSKDFARSLGIPFFHDFVDVPAYAAEKGLSIEEAARELRYRFLEKVLEKWGGDRIATAHTLSDSVETVLFNLFRGSGPAGLAGIPPSRGRIIRPIISFTRDEIIFVLDECKIPYVIDSTNLKLDYTRNYIRHAIIPVVKRRFPRFEASVASASHIFREEREFFERESERIKKSSFKFDLSGSVDVFDTKVLKSYHRAELYWFFHMYLKLDFIHVEEAVELIYRQQGRLKIPGGMLIKSYDELAVIKGELMKLDSGVFSPPFEVNFPFPNYRIVATMTDEAEFIRDPLVFFWHEPGEFEIGPRKPGDRVEIPGVGVKKLKEVFIEKKIPSWRRDLFPVVRQGGKILWVPLVYKHRFKHSHKFVKLEVKKIDERKGWIFNT